MPKRQSAYSQILKEKQKEAEEPVEQLDDKTPSQQDVQEFEQPTSGTSEQQNGQLSKQTTSKPAKQQRIKATFYLQVDDIIAIDEMQTKRFRQTGKKPEKSELVSEAIQLLFKQQNS